MFSHCVNNFLCNYEIGYKENDLKEYLQLIHIPTTVYHSGITERYLHLLYQLSNCTK